MVNDIVNYEKILVSDKDYEEFKNKEWLFLSIKGLRFGQAFCEHFKLNVHTPLYYFKDFKICDKWIRSNCIKK